MRWDNEQGLKGCIAPTKHDVDAAAANLVHRKAQLLDGADCSSRIEPPLDTIDQVAFKS